MAANQSKTIGIIVLCITMLGFVFFLFSFCCFLRRKRQRKYKKKEKIRHVFRYLSHFDVEDLDFRLSPTGGIHVAYKNEMAEGKIPASSSSSFIQSTIYTENHHSQDEGYDGSVGTVGSVGSSSSEESHSHPKANDDDDKNDDNDNTKKNDDHHPSAANTDDYHSNHTRNSSIGLESGGDDEKEEEVESKKSNLSQQI